MSELIVGVVPIRSFRGGKTRLSTILSPAQREAVMRGSSERVIRSALDSRAVDTVVVVSPDDDVLAWASELGSRVRAIRQPADRPGLNGAIDTARDWALERDADRLLSLFADLPLLSMYDIRVLTSRRAPVVFGPDRRGEGTNAMLLHLQGPGETFRFSFGEASLEKHLAEAERLGMRAVVQAIPGVAFDLDTPLDWLDYLAADGDHGKPLAGIALTTPGARDG